MEEFDRCRLGHNECADRFLGACSEEWLGKLPVLTRDNLRVEVPYHYHEENGFEGFLWSPDGRGCYFYDTLAEMEEQHGDEPRPRVVRLHHEFC